MAVIPHRFGSIDRTVACVHSAVLLCPRVWDLFTALLTLGGQCAVKLHRCAVSRTAGPPVLLGVRGATPIQVYGTFAH